MTNPSSGEPKPAGNGLPRPASTRHLPHAVHPPHTTKGEDLLEGVGLQPTAAEVRREIRAEERARRGDEEGGGGGGAPLTRARAPLERARTPSNHPTTPQLMPPPNPPQRPATPSHVPSFSPFPLDPRHGGTP